VGERPLEAAVHLAPVRHQRRLQDVGDPRLLGLAPRVGPGEGGSDNHQPGEERRQKRTQGATQAAAPSTRGRSSRSIQSTIAWVDVPGVKIAATPSAFSSAASSSGTIPPPNSTTSPAPAAFSAWSTAGKWVIW